MEKGLASESAKIAQLPWKGKKPFYGWIIVGAGVVTQFFQGVTNQGFGTYFTPLQAEFGWTKATLAAPRSVTQLENSILGPIEGYLMDKLGPRVMATIGIFVMGLGLIMFGLTNGLFLYVLSNILIAAGTGFQGMLVMSVAVNNWFRRKRTMAQAIMLLGFATAGVIGVPAVVATQVGLGWRTAAIGSGIFIWAFGFPVAMLLRTRPEPYGLLPDGDPPSTAAAPKAQRGRTLGVEYDFTLREAVRTRSFWLLAVGWAIGNLGMGSAQLHVYAHLEEGVGLSRATTALVWSVASLTNIPSRLIGGFLGDRLPKRVMLASATILMGASIYVLAIATSAQMAFTYAVLYGIGWGVRTPVMNAIQADYFGRKSLGKIVGWLQTLSLPVGIAAPILVGYVADVQHTYLVAFSVAGIISVIGGAVLFLASPPKRPRPTHDAEHAA